MTGRLILQVEFRASLQQTASLAGSGQNVANRTDRPSFSGGPAANGVLRGAGVETAGRKVRAQRGVSTLASTGLHSAGRRPAAHLIETMH